jgi:hypothetical protein
MLSKIELQYSTSPESFDANYRGVLHYRIKVNVEALSRELPLLADVMKECNGITEFRNGEQSPNQGALDEIECGRRDLNPGRRRGRPMS